MTVKLVYGDTVVTPVANEDIDFPVLRKRLREAAPAEGGWLWCRWPNGQLWKHWRAQLRTPVDGC